MTAVAARGRAGPRSPLAIVAWSAALLSLAAFAMAWALAIGDRDLFDIASSFGPDRFMVMWTVVGAFLSARRSASPIGWLLLGAAFVESARALAGEYALHAAAGAAPPGVAVWAAWYVNWSLTLLFPCGIVVFLLLLFPDGRLVSSRWRLVTWAAVGLAVLFLVLSWLRRGHHRRYGAGPPAGHRRGGAEVPALLHRPDHLPDGLLRRGDRPGGRDLPRLRRPAHQ